MVRDFEKHVRDEIASIYNRVDGTDIRKNDVSINIHANVDYDGNLVIKYSMVKGYNNQTEGATLIAVFDEFLRRQGWNKRNDPTKQLTDDRVIDGEAEIIQPPELTNQ